MAVKVFSETVIGLNGILVEVEVDISATSLPSFVIVGLPDTAVQESRERIRSAIKNSGFKFPAARIAVNLAPADIKKQGPSFDLPIALALLLASGQCQVNKNLSDFVVWGELSLDGSLRSVVGALPMVIAAKEHSCNSLILPQDNVNEARAITGVNIYGFADLAAVAAFISEKNNVQPAPPKVFDFSGEKAEVDFGDIKGQEAVKRALEIAAAGGHNILMSGPPGSGKTLLARALVGILPRLSLAECLEITKIHSVAGLLAADKPLIGQRPFRSPHHTSSAVALVGGGSFIKPGEISLAHRGVLFLDEFSEFPRGVLDSLRQPLEDGIVTISRAQGSVQFPAQFMLVAAMNPCPCGYFSDPDKHCLCTPGQLISYQKKISGPLLDRIDLHVEVPRISYEKLTGLDSGESSRVIRQRVEKARIIQEKRFTGKGLFTNTEMSVKEIEKHCSLEKEAEDVLRQAVVKMSLSARSYHRLLKLSRTISDLMAEEKITSSAVAESLQYRPKVKRM